MCCCCVCMRGSSAFSWTEYESVAELGSDILHLMLAQFQNWPPFMTLLHYPAKRVALSRWHLKESWFWVSALILIGVRISGSLSFLTYVHWLPCNALRRGGYLQGSNFVNLATPTTPRHQLPGLPSNQTDFAQFEFTTVQLWSSHCKAEPPSKQTVCTVTDCQGIFVENIAMEM